MREELEFLRKNAEAGLEPQMIRSLLVPNKEQSKTQETTAAFVPGKRKIKLSVNHRGLAQTLLREKSAALTSNQPSNEESTLNITEQLKKGQIKNHELKKMFNQFFNRKESARSAEKDVVYRKELSTRSPESARKTEAPTIKVEGQLLNEKKIPIRPLASHRNHRQSVDFTTSREELSYRISHRDPSHNSTIEKCVKTVNLGPLTLSKKEALKDDTSSRPHYEVEMLTSHQQFFLPTEDKGYVKYNRREPKQPSNRHKGSLPAVFHEVKEA